MQITGPIPARRYSIRVLLFFYSLTIFLVWVLAISCFLALLVVAIFLPMDLVNNLAVTPSRWPTVQGTIIYSDAYQTQNMLNYRNVVFIYVVDDEVYSAFQSFQPGLDEDLKYSQGKIMPVYYSHLDPGMAFIKPDEYEWWYDNNTIWEILFCAFLIPIVVGSIIILKWVMGKYDRWLNKIEG